MKFLFNLKLTTRIVLGVLLLFAALLTWYSGLALYRLTWGLLDLVENPRSFPHADSLILWLNDWFDKRHPLPPGFIKLHGELDRVRWTFLAVFVPSALSSLILLQLVLAPWIFPATRRLK